MMSTRRDAGSFLPPPAVQEMYELNYQPVWMSIILQLDLDLQNRDLRCPSYLARAALIGEGYVHLDIWADGVVWKYGFENMNGR